MKYKYLLTFVYSITLWNLFIYGGTGEGISPKGTLRSINSGIIGKVFDAKTLLPIQNVNVNLIGTFSSTSTDQNGRYVMVANPGFGYFLKFSSQNYVSATVGNIVFNSQNLAFVNDLYLQPLSELEYDLFELSPNPNPQVSKVRTGGSVKRYYLVKGKQSFYPVNEVPVEFKRTDGLTKSFISQNYGDQNSKLINGMVIAEFDQEDDIGCSNCSVSFSLSKIGSKVVTNSPISFVVDVEPRQYQKEFEIAREIEIGFGLALGKNITGKVGDNTAGKFILKQKDGQSEPYKLGMDMSFENWLGIEIGVGAGTRFKVGPVYGGVYGNIGEGGYGTFSGEAKYLYNYNSPTNNEEARAKLLNLMKIAKSLGRNPLAARIELVLYTMSNWNYLETVGGGFGLRGSGEGEAVAGIFTAKRHGFLLGGKLEGSAEQGGKIEYEYNNATDLHYGSLTLYDKASLNGGIGLLTWGYGDVGNPDFKKFNKIIEKSKLGLTANILDWNRSFKIKYGGQISSLPEIYLESKVGFYNWKRSFRLNYSHSNLNSMIGSSLWQGVISLANPYAPFQNFGGIVGGFIYSSTHKLLSNIADKQTLESYPPLNYEIDSSKVVPGFVFPISIDWKIKFSLELGLNIEWNTSYKSLIEKGVFLSGIDYPLENYTTIPEVSVSMPTVISKIVLDGLKTLTLSDILSIICISCVVDKKNTDNNTPQLITLSEIGSTLEIDLSALPPGLDSLTCNMWNWYGNSTNSKLSDLDEGQKTIALTIKRQQQSVAKMEYGIGGFYKFEPQAVGLSIPATLTIVYPDSDVVGLDENNLAVFYQDTTSNDWKYLGGVVYPDSNKIRVSVDTLQLYTIAPIMPSGEIGLSTNKDTITTNYNNLATIVSDTLKLANGTNVGSGSLYTVTVENLEVQNSDADTSMTGVQVASNNSLLNIQVKSTNTPGKGKILIESVNGISKGSIGVMVIDTIASVAMVLDSIKAADNGAIIYVTNPDTNDIVQYEVHYGLTSGGPYNGPVLAGGQNSPFVVNALDSVVLGSLLNDSIYFIVVKAIDRGGNRSGFSNELSVVPIDTVKPDKIKEIDFTFMPDSSYLVRWIASGDNGNEGTANRYYLKLSNQIPTDTLIWWQNAGTLDNVTAPSQAGLFDYHVLRDIDTSYYLGIQVEDEVGNKSEISVFNIKPNRGTRSLQLRKGWNLVSHPINQNNVSVTSVLPLIIGGPYVFDMTNGYVQQDTIAEKKGYWIRLSDKYDISLNGRIIEDTILTVKTGWNLIGSNSSTVNKNDIYTQPSGIIQSLFYGYDSAGYYSSNQIRYGSGYWVRVSQDGNLILPRQSGIVKKIENPELSNEGFEITSGTGHRRNLWIVENSNSSFYEAPPLAPGNNFDIRFTGNLYGESKAKSAYQITIINGEYPLQIKSSVEDEEYDVSGDITKKYYGKLTGDNQIKIVDVKDVSLTFSKLTIPTEYYLSQNYPNPFNPTTTIKFGLPQDQKVRIVVYDILGQEVERILNDKQLKAGHHTIEWDASKYSSGIYLLNIQAGSFSSVKKMMLLK